MSDEVAKLTEELKREKELSASLLRKLKGVRKRRVMDQNRYKDDLRSAYMSYANSISYDLAGKDTHRACVLQVEVRYWRDAYIKKVHPDKKELNAKDTECIELAKSAVATNLREIAELRDKLGLDNFMMIN